jgi:hypothetical protein
MFTVRKVAYLTLPTLSGSRWDILSKILLNFKENADAQRLTGYDISN